MNLVKNVKTLFKVIRQLIYILSKKQKKRGIVVFVCMFFAAILETVGISIVMPFISAMTEPKILMENIYIEKLMRICNIETANELLVLMGLGIIFVYVVKNIYLWIYQVITIKYECQIEQDLSTLMLNSYMKRPYSFFLNTNSAIILRGIGGDISGVYSIISCLFTLATQILTIIFIGIFILSLDLEIALGLIGATVICVIVIVLGFKKITKNAGQEYMDANVEVNKYAYQAISGIKEITVLHRREYFINKYRESYKKAARSKKTYTIIQQSPVRIMEASFVSAVIGIVCIKILQGMDANSYVSQLGAFAVAGFRLLPMISAIPVNISALVYYQPCLEDVYTNIRNARLYEAEVEKCKNRQSDIKHNVLKMNFENDIVIGDLSFRYPGTNNYVLDKANLTIHKGRSIGIIGESGAGKSTFGDILLGLFKPDAGTICMDGVSIFSMPEQWAKTIGYVPQTVYLIDDTIRNNVAFGLNADEVTDDKIWEALEQAQLKEFVEQLPQKLNTIVGERGIRFSGGQRQRVAIARAIYFNPDILLLDEATSALDNETEKTVMQAIEQFKGKKTLIIIAHRLTTIRKCDEVYEIQNGHFIEKSKESLDVK